MANAVKPGLVPYKVVALLTSPHWSSISLDTNVCYYNYQHT